MDKSCVISLISTVYTTDAIGQKIPEKVYYPIYAQRQSISNNEYYQAGQAGLNPSCMFKVRSFEYTGEKSLLYAGKEYGIYRSYERKDEYTELYVQDKGGI